LTLSKKTEEILKECTFEPKLLSKNKPKSHPRAHLISGLERFYELRDLQERKKQDQKKIEEKVFHIEKKYEKNKHFVGTVPSPFNLTGKNAQKK